MSYPTYDYTFESFRNSNVQRCEADDGFKHPISSWSETDLACALAGEVGELCNLIKKHRRGEDVKLVDVAREISDAFTYLDLLAARMGIELDVAIRLKFNEVSKRIWCDVQVPGVSNEWAKRLNAADKKETT